MDYLEKPKDNQYQLKIIAGLIEKFNCIGYKPIIITYMRFTRSVVRGYRNTLLPPSLIPVHEMKDRTEN